MAQLDAQAIINYIGTAPKKTPVKVYVKGTDLKALTFPAEVEAFVEQTTGVLFGDWQVLKPFLAEHEADFAAVRVENAARNSAVPLLDLKEVNARIEPGATIRDQVLIGDNCGHHDGRRHQHRGRNRGGNHDRHGGNPRWPRPGR